MESTVHQRPTFPVPALTDNKGSAVRSGRSELEVTSHSSPEVGHFQDGQGLGIYLDVLPRPEPSVTAWLPLSKHYSQRRYIGKYPASVCRTGTYPVSSVGGTAF